MFLKHTLSQSFHVALLARARTLSYPALLSPHHNLMAAVGAWAAWEAEFVAAVFNVDAASLPMESPSSGTLLDAALASTLDSLVTLVLNDPTLVRSGTGGLVWMIASWARADAVHTGHADVAASARLSAFLAGASAADGGGEV